MLCAFTAPDSPNFLSMYPMASGTDYAEQTLSVNDTDDQVISELMRRVCYNQSIYDDSLVEGSEYLVSHFQFLKPPFILKFNKQLFLL